MGWTIKQYPDGKYGLWTTVADGYIVRKAKKEYVIDMIKSIWQEKLAEEIKELEEKFPIGWYDKDTHSRIS